MSGLLAFAGGFAEGVGAGIVEKGRQDRDDRIREQMYAREDRHRSEDRANAVADREDAQAYQTGERVAGQDFTSSENAANREFTRGERIAGQEFTSGENAANRDFTADQNDKNREHDRTMNSETVADVITGGDGKLHAVTRTGGTRPIVDSDGNGISPDKSKQYQDAVQDIFGKLLENNPEYGDARKSTDELMREAEKRAADLINGTISDPDDGGEDFPAAPMNLSERTVGQVYSAPDGRRVKWTEKGWLEVTG